MDGTHFDVIVVGSGFGGSVVAYRLAEAGLRVCLLERESISSRFIPSQPLRDESQPLGPERGFARHVQRPGRSAASVDSSRAGSAVAHSSTRTFCCEKDPKKFVKEDVNGGGREYWPISYDDLEPHYVLVEQMLNVQHNPFEPDSKKRVPARSKYDRTPKTNAMQEAASRLGLEWGLPNLAVTFANAGEEQATAVPICTAPENIYGRTRLTCALTGECDLGCKYGSKNTLDLTYLSVAKLRHGAEIWTRCEVKAFAPREGGGYTIEYVDHRDAVEGENRTVACCARL